MTVFTKRMRRVAPAKTPSVTSGCGQRGPITGTILSSMIACSGTPRKSKPSSSAFRATRNMSSAVASAAHDSAVSGMRVTPGTETPICMGTPPPPFGGPVILLKIGGRGGERRTLGTSSGYALRGGVLWVRAEDAGGTPVLEENGLM